LIKHNVFKFCGNYGAILALNESGVCNENVLKESFRIVQVQTPHKEILHVHSLLVAPQRYTLMGKNKIRKLENYAHEEAQTFAYNRSKKC
jgi:hypothetical protein